MLPFEWLVVAYFSALAAVATVVRVDGGQNARALVRAVAVGASAVVAAQVLNEDLRAWLPHAYLAFGYWVPALLAPRSFQQTSFERWLQRTEAWWRPYAVPVPRWLAPGLELSYLLCYPLVPVSFVVVSSSGTSADINRFWLSVLASGFCCYATIPWLVGRPPRSARSAPRGQRGLPWFNVFVLDRVSHGLVTFPSGHAAVATAAAIVTMTVNAPAGFVIGLAAIGVAVGAVVGRYHYTIDVVFGIAVGLVNGVGSHLAVGYDSVIPAG